MKGDFFMKRLLIILAAVISVCVFNKSKNESVVIPSSSIRFRVVSNSNAPKDIKIKLDLKRKLEDYLYEKVAGAKDVNEADGIVSLELNNINELIRQNLMSDYFTVSYGMNYFPSKIYKGVVYDGGYYKSLVVTLGDGDGDNWWCVLFPPLCLVEDNETTGDVEYKLFVKSIIEKFR